MEFMFLRIRKLFAQIYYNIKAYRCPYIRYPQPPSMRRKIIFTIRDNLRNIKDMKKIILLCILLISSGCRNFSTPEGETSTNSQKSTPSTLSRITSPIQKDPVFEGLLEWTHADAAPWSLCGAQIHANIEFTFAVNGSEVAGSGNILYKDIEYGTTRTCSDCFMDFLDATITVTGTALEDSAEIQLTLDEPIEEYQSSAQCFPEMQTSHVLEHSLQQAGLFQPFTVSLPDKNPSTKTFSWDVAEQTGSGTLAITKK